MKKLDAFDAIVVFIMLPFATIFSAWVTCQLWGWFIVPIFHLDPLSMIQALGLGLIIGYFAHQYVKQSLDMGDWIVFLWVKPAVFLIVGWFYHLFM